uniref:TIMELESS-interacting protein n=1 Tax=Panagrellus redivivus TaxID=6233 RepID=A0A7E4VLS2_PANRE
MEDYGDFDDNLFDGVDQVNDNAPENGDDALDNVIRKVEADVKPKRKINTKPQPKLTERELTGEKGLCALRKMFETYQPNKKKSPYDNLDDVMQKVEYWAHLLYPKATFDDFLAKVENVGKKRAVKVYMTKLRHGMPLFEDTATGSASNPVYARSRSPSPMKAASRAASVDSFDDDDINWDVEEPASKPVEEIDYEAEWAAAEASAKSATPTATVPKAVNSTKELSPLHESDSESEQITYKPPNKSLKARNRRQVHHTYDIDSDGDPVITVSKNESYASYKDSDAELESRKSLQARNRRLVLDSDEEMPPGSDSEDETSKKAPTSSPKDKLTIESDSEDDSRTVDNPENVPPVNSPNPVKRRKVIIDSDDDEVMSSV